MRKKENQSTEMPMGQEKGIDQERKSHRKSGVSVGTKYSEKNPIRKEKVYKWTNDTN